MFLWTASWPECIYHFSCCVTSGKDDLENSVLVAASGTMIIILLSPCWCFILSAHTALYIRTVFLINAYSSWKPDLESGGLNPTIIFSFSFLVLTWSICLLTCFYPRTEVFLNYRPLLQIYIKQFSLLSAPEKNRLC